MSWIPSSASPAAAVVYCLSLVLSAARLPAAGRADSPTAPPQLAPNERAAKLAERNRLWKEAGELRTAGKFGEAVERLGLHIPVQRKLFGLGTTGEAEALEQIALNERDRRLWAAARSAAAEALAIREKVRGKDNWRTTDARLLAADIDRWEKLTAAQRQQLAEADRLISEVGRLKGQGKYRESLEPAQQALALRRQVLGEDHRSTGDARAWLGYLHDNAGDYPQAEPLYKQALEIRRKSLGETHPDYASGLNNLAVLYKNAGDYARAEPLHKQALEIRKKSLGEVHPDYARSLDWQGIIELDLGRPTEAEKFLRQAVQIQRKSLDLTAAVQSEQQQLAMSRQVRGHLDNYLSAALAAGVEPGEVYAEVAAWKGSVSAQQQLLRARQRALATDPGSTLGRLFARLDADSRRLAALLRVTPKPGQEARLQTELAELTESVNSLQQQLARLDPDFHRAWADRKISPDELRKVLPADAALVDLLEYQHYIPPAAKGKKATWQWRFAAFVLRRDRPIACVELGASAPVGELVRAWRAGFGTLATRSSGARDEPSAAGAGRPGEPSRAGTERPSSTGGAGAGALAEPMPGAARLAAPTTPAARMPGDELRRLIWQPLEKQLAGASIVLVSPDGALAQLPWGALPGETAGTFSIEERAIAVIPIPQMLPELLKSPARTGPPASLLLAGDIDYGGDPGTPPPAALAVRSAAARRTGQLEFKKLEGAQAELASIERRYRKRVAGGNSSALEGSDATEGAFRQQAPNYPWLHVITHGFFAPSEPPLAAPAGSAGIGAALEVKDGHCRVTQLVPGLAAAKDGRLKAGDEITAVAQSEDDWTPVGGKELSAIVGLIRGPVGSTVRVCVRPHDKPEDEIKLSLVRAALPAPASKPSAPVDPGMLSGLAFSGANASPAEGKDDGILTALEVSSLDLSRVDTVVLSACETGLGQSAGGEGLLGLQRAFQVAGAKTAVASLWKVPDAATGRLMQRFYQNMWDKKMPKLAALREAQIYMLRDRGNRGLAIEASQPADGEGLPPFYWAAFVLSGDWR